MDQHSRMAIALGLGASRTRRRLIGTAARGTIGGLGAALIARGLGPSVFDGGIGSVALAQDAAVSIVDNRFEPAELEIPLGTTVTWTNNGARRHTVTADPDPNLFDSGQLNPGMTFPHTFDAVGTFDYLCINHANMEGKVTVIEGGTPTPPKVYVRPNLLKMTPAAQADYLQTYAEGVKAMKARDAATGDPKVFRTSWLYQANIHGVPQSVRDELGAAELANRAWATCQHHQWFFFPWHRMYVYWWEKILRKAIPDPVKAENFALAYWDYFPATQRVLPNQFFMPADDTNPLYLDGRGPFVSGGATWPANREYIFDHQPAFTHMNFSHGAGGISFGGRVNPVAHQGLGGGQLENVTHDWVHGYVGGLMGNPNTAGHDPIFWLHHANIDRLWSRWLDQPMVANPSETKPEDAPWYAAEFLFFTDDGDEVHMTGKQILDTLCQLDYRYEDDDPNTVCAPPEAAGTPVASAAIVPEPEVVAEAEAPTELGPELTRVPIELGEATASVLEAAAAPPEAGGPAATVVLSLVGVRGTGVSGVSNEIYLNLPEGVEPDPSGPYFVGLISLFGSQPDNLDEHAPPVQSFDISENLRALQEQGEKPQQLVLTFVPFAYGGVSGEATPEAEAVGGPWISFEGYTVAVQ